jgi:hypothetical protein
MKQTIQGCFQTILSYVLEDYHVVEDFSFNKKSPGKLTRAVTLLTGLRGVPDLDVSQNIHCPG